MSRVLTMVQAYTNSANSYWIRRGCAATKRRCRPGHAKDVALLSFLVQNARRRIDKSEILDAVWGGTFVELGNLAVTISHVRRTFGDSAQNSLYIETIPPRGYLFVAEITEKQNELVEAMRECVPAPATSPRKNFIAAISVVLWVSVAVFPFVWFRGKKRDVTKGRIELHRPEK
jgi:DNA-binding winged helix-turn-helix (wHTH) protein